MKIARYLTWMLFFNFCSACFSAEDQAPYSVQVQEQLADLKSRYESSLQACLQRLKTDPGDLPARLALADLYRFAGSCDEALAEYDKVIALQPDNVQALTGKGDCYLKLGYYSYRAIQTFERVRELVEARKMDGFDHAQLYYKLGRAYEAAEDEKKASEYFQRSLGIDATNAEARAALGRSYYGQGLMDKALKELQAASELAPNDTGSLLYIGYIYGAKKDYSGAAKVFRWVIELDPVNSQAYRGLIKTFIQVKEYGLAHENYQKALSLFPEDKYLLDRAAEFYYEQKDYARAIEYAQKAIRGHESDKWDNRKFLKKKYLFLLDCYLARNDPKTGVAWLRKACPNLLWELIGFVLLIFLPALMAFWLGQRMLKKIPPEEGEERIRYFHRFRNRVRWLLSIGWSTIIVAYFVSDLHYGAKLLHVHEAIIILGACFIQIVLLNIVFFHIDRRVRRTSATFKVYFLAMLGYYVPFLLVAFLGFQLYSLRAELLSSWGGSAVFVFLLMVLVYGSGALYPWIIRLTRRTRPVPEGLRSRLDALCRKTGVQCRIFILETDALKFSNMLAEGLWPGNYRVYIFSYALEKLSPEELDNIFLHELAHFKMDHPRIRLHIIFVFLLLLVLGDTLLRASGMVSYQVVLVVTAIVSYVLISRWISRRQEKEADEFAVARSDAPQAMVTALQKAYRDNYVPRDYKAPQHPPLEERIKYIKNKIAGLETGRASRGDLP